MAWRPGTWTVRLLLAALVATALAYVPYRVYGSEGYSRYRELERQLGELEAGNARLRADNQRLLGEISRLRDDLDAVAQVARDELGMVGPGEIVIKIDHPGGFAPGLPGGAARAADPDRFDRGVAP